MKKTLTSIVALMFTFAVGAVFAAAHMKETALETACKDKKPGTEVTVDGKKTKCPEPKKAEPAPKK
jgi:uncharacterized protein YxeA